MDFQKDLIAEYDRETAKTRKMLEAIPADADLNYKPHPKSMSLGRLAGHLTDMTGEWAITTLTKDKLEFAADHKWEPTCPRAKRAAGKFDKELPDGARGLAASPADEWDQNWKFIFGGHAWIDDAAPPGLSRNGVEPHDSPSRAVERVSAVAEREDSGLYGPSADEM